jgi:Adenine-specific DNA methylase containing a Zn-ribbon
MNNNTNSNKDLKDLAIEGKLPLKAVGIENLKEDNPKHMPPNRYLFPWYARRPTPAARLAVLASVLPSGASSDDILDLMQIKPRSGIDIPLEEYVINKKSTEGERSGTLGEHYGYPRPFESSPDRKQQQELHSKLRDFWNGDLPTVLDPTAGSGVIPLESLRYGLPTKANELNPVPSVMLKVVLDYPISAGHLRQEVEQWGSKIDEIATEELQEYYPSQGNSQTPSHYISTYTITCPNCGCDLPLTSKLWLLKRSSSEGIAARPDYSDGELSFERVELPDDVTKQEFNPQDGPRSRGGNTECPNCEVVTESSEVKSRVKDGEYEYNILGVKYTKSSGGSGYRVANKEDYIGYEKAVDRVESDFNLFSLLTQKIAQNGQKTSEPAGYGFSEWRDVFTDRQLVALYEYWQAFEQVKDQIKEQYPQEKSEAIMAILALAGGKMVDRNSRLSPYDIQRGYPMHLTGAKNLSPQWQFTDNNPSSGNQQYLDILDRILGSYEKIVGYLENSETEPAEILTGDAADLNIEENSVESVVVDPPYYSSIMYAELSDIFYVWLKQYLDDVFPDLFTEELTDKDSEAVANPSRFSDVAENTSKKDLARRDYEDKMSDIFSEIYRVVEPGGVMTVMFTHKETDAWDTLTKSLINSGFTITATHPITSERPNRTDTQGSGSADSTLLLVGRKPHQTDEKRRSTPTLWSDVKHKTRAAAKNAARDLIDSSFNLTKTDIIISAFGPTLRVFAESYPVVDDQDEDVPPRQALEEAREAVTRVLAEEYLEAEGIDDLDGVTEWYILCWLVYGKQTFSYDEGHQLGLGVGIDVDDIKRNTKIWRRSSGDIKLRGYSDRVQNINEKPENRSSRTPVNPDDLSFGLALDKVHAAMHVYDVQGESACCDWLRERNFDSDSTFKSTLKALLQVLPHDYEDWELARDLAAGRTRDVLDLDFSPNVFAEDSEQTQQKGIDDY